MQLNDFLKTNGPKVRKALMRHLDVSKSYLSQMATGRASINAERCIEIEKFTHGAVSRADLRPQDWHRIWPDYDIESTSNKNKRID